MAHWEHRKEKNWSKFHFNQPYAKGLKRLREEVLAGTDFDPAVLWQWGTMQAMAVVRILKDCENIFGEQGQQTVGDALRKVGHDIGEQLFKGLARPQGLSEAEIISYFATVVNRIAYASLEEPRIDSDDKVSFDIIWCPHQDHYSAFDCRVQRYLVQGMLEAFSETGWISRDWQVKFTCTIPSGSPVCNFVLWKSTPQEKAEWEMYTAKLEQKALKQSREN